jgi:hypothetical protein
MVRTTVIAHELISLSNVNIIGNLLISGWQMPRVRYILIAVRCARGR